jgi:predicted metal-binding membrane protein
MTVRNPVAEAVIRRDRMVVSFGLAAILIVAAYFTIDMARYHNGIASVMLDHHHALASETTDGFWHLFSMWTVMQIAMMSPTAVPMILMHTKVQRTRIAENSPILHTTVFFLGYIIMWTACSAVFAGVQVWMQSMSLLTPAMASASPWLAGGILIAAGAFQFSKLKEVCLNGCRTPVTFFMTEWREGYGGALLMGLKHGLHCVGCCWVLMALLFVAGVMNLLWMAIITVFILLEKVLPKGAVFGRVGGVAMILWGMALMVLPLIAW